MRRRWLWGASILLVFGVAIAALSFAADVPLRRTIERRMNARMKGYTARIGSVDFHPIRLSITFHDVQLIQNAHPDPAVLRVQRLTASVHWRAILHGRLVGDFLLVQPEVHVDRTQFVREAQDPTPMKAHGWQDALEAMYPLKVNLFRIDDGSVTYIEAGQSRPLTVRGLSVSAENIRNVESASNTYPSPLKAEATVFEQGRLAIAGSADFLRKPFVGVKGRIEATGIDLDYFAPIAARYGFTVKRGIFGGAGNVEYSPDIAAVDLDDVQIDHLEGDYTHRQQTTQPVQRAAKKTVEKAKAVSNAPDVLLKARRISVNGATLGFVNAEASPQYRVFLDGANILIEQFTNQLTEGSATAKLTGRFMGTGQTAITATFLPETHGAHFTVNSKIEHTDMRQMNDLLRAHAKVDVTSGTFSVFSELSVDSGHVDGYVKPLFRDLQVYDPQKDGHKSLAQKAKEKLADVAATILKNRPRQEVATVTPIQGAVGQPQAGMLQTLVGLVQNAFFKAILPGFSRERSQLARQ